MHKKIDGYILDQLDKIKPGESIFVSIQPKNVLSKANLRGIKVKAAVVIVVEPFVPGETVKSYKITKVTLL